MKSESRTKRKDDDDEEDGASHDCIMGVVSCTCRHSIEGCA